MWADLDPFRAADAAILGGTREKRYALTMFPYPSGDLHMGHAEVFALHDVMARYWWLRGYEVLNPMGFDSFGLNAENAAIRDNEHPATFTYANIAISTESCRKFGTSFDWSRTLNTSDPEYYRWTQWLFLKFRERGLAYRKESPVNWCPVDQTVLANEQVIDGHCERCGAEVTKRELTQWYFKITDYAQELLDNLDVLEPTWPDRVINAQRNWIGRSEGAHVTFDVVDGDPLTVYTTRPDTLFGATFMVVAADAHLAAELVTDEQRPAYEAYLEEVRKASDIERLSTDREKSGVFLGRYAVNPVNGQQIPIWAADYVLADYGTGAIMAVPGQDQRDWDFAEKFGLPIVRTVQPSEGFEEDGGKAYTGQGPAINSANDEISLDGMDDRRGEDGDHRLAGGQRARQARGELPAARLAAVAAALLGRADPDRALPVLRRGAGPRGPAARRTAGAARGRPDPAGRLATGGRRGLGQRRVPLVRRPRQAGQRHDGHLRGLVVVLPALLLAARRHPGVRQRPGQRMGSVRRLHRRRRARGAAPAVRPLLHDGAERHGPGRLPRAVLGTAEPGHRDQRGRQDVEVQGQRRSIGGATWCLRRGRGPADAGVRRPPGGRHRLGGHVARRVGAVPAAGVAAER